MFTQGINRIPSKLGAADLVTFQIRQPIGTHWREATCKEVECSAWAYGWSTYVDTTTLNGRNQADYIRARSGRAFTEVTGERAGMIEFMFPQGQRCFAAPHRVPLDRPALYVVRGGDWRGNPRQVPLIRHAGPVDWRDHFGEHQERLAARAQQG